MAGMRALGRVYDIVGTHAASGSGVVSMKNCSGVGVFLGCGTTASSTITVTAGTVFGTYSAGHIASPPTAIYSRAEAGTAAWAPDTITWVTSTGVGTIAGATAGTAYYLDFFGSMLADGYDYLKVLASADLFVLAMIAYDMTVQRKPQNLEIISS